MMISAEADSRRNEKNPRRVAAGRLNGAKRRPWNDEDRQRLRVQCLERRPWTRSTGPRTEEGKYRARVNGYCHQPDPDSRRQIRAGLHDTYGLIAQMQNSRRSIFGQRDG